MNTKKKGQPHNRTSPSNVCNSNFNTASAQRNRILAHLEKNRSLTTLQARRLLDVMHPAARVMELRKRGYDILTNWKYDTTTEGGKHRVAEYVLMGVIEDAA